MCYLFFHLLLLPLHIFLSHFICSGFSSHLSFEVPHFFLSSLSPCPLSIPCSPSLPSSISLSHTISGNIFPHREKSRCYSACTLGSCSPLGSAPPAVPTVAGYGLHLGPPPTHLALGDTKTPWWMDACVIQTPQNLCQCYHSWAWCPELHPCLLPKRHPCVPNFQGGEGFPRQGPFIQRLLQEQG